MGEFKDKQNVYYSITRSMCSDTEHYHSCSRCFSVRRRLFQDWCKILELTFWLPHLTSNCKFMSPVVLWTSLQVFAFFLLVISYSLIWQVVCCLSPAAKCLLQKNQRCRNVWSVYCMFFELVDFLSQLVCVFLQNPTILQNMRKYHAIH